MIEDEVLFTPQLATVVVELQRDISAILDTHLGVSYTEFCLLASLQSHGGTMLLSDFPTSIGANANTVVAASSRLDEKGLVLKEKSSEDKRVIVLRNTEKTLPLVQEGCTRVYAHLYATVWKNHSDEDIREIMYSFGEQHKTLHIDPIEVNTICHPIMTPAYFMALSGILSRWSSEVKTYSGLSLTEFRYLSLLESRPRPLNCSQLAAMLFLDRSSISSITASLKEKELIIVERGKDKRSNLVSLTEKGAVCAALVNAKLSRATAVLYADIDPALKTKTNELHMRMYTTHVT